MNKQKQTSYKDAGVDIDAGNKLVKDIAPLAKSTMRPGADVELGGFGGLFDLAAVKYKDPVLVSANDGVGTKLKIAFEVGIHKTVGVDLVAMCVNDLIVQGAEPLFFLDYFATGGLDNNVAYDVISGIADGCRQANAALIGGETAEMPGMYAKGHYDLAGFAVGAVERDQILPTKNIKEGDVLIGLASSGVHSNGFSLVRHIIDNNDLCYNDIAPFENDRTLGQVLLTPTKIYVKSCMSLIKQEKLKALAHITGGGFVENIPRVLNEDLAVEIDLTSWDMPAIFPWLQKMGNVAEDECLRTFNNGVGMVLVIDEADVDFVLDDLQKNNQKAYKIGVVQNRLEKDGQKLAQVLFKGKLYE